VSDRLLTAKQVADLLAVPESWVREATREGRIPHLRLGRYRRYQPAAIDAWLAENRGESTAVSGRDLRSGPG
jgi:excisionase family DNA binding protein